MNTLVFVTALVAIFYVVWRLAADSADWVPGASSSRLPN
jgi:hypothetical protein